LSRNLFNSCSNTIKSKKLPYFANFCTIAIYCFYSLILKYFLPNNDVNRNISNFGKNYHIKRIFLLHFSYMLLKLCNLHKFHLFPQKVPFNRTERGLNTKPTSSSAKALGTAFFRMLYAALTSPLMIFPLSH
jgi:hypothetical protein